MPNNQEKFDQLWLDAVGGIDGVKTDGRLFHHAKWGNQNSADAVNYLRGVLGPKIDQLLAVVNESREYSRESWFTLRPGVDGVNWGGTVHDKLVLGVRPEVKVIKEDVAVLKTELAAVKATLAEILAEVKK